MSKVSYFFNQQIGDYYYYKDHPMKPRRIAMTHSLIQSFQILPKLDLYQSRKATKQQLIQFHHQQYINYLQNYVSKSILKSQGFMYTNDKMLKSQQQRQMLIKNNKKKGQFYMCQAGDCPAFQGLYQFCQLSCGGSIDCANVLLNGDADITINWGGGLHHAKKCQASGFCYTNDIVLAILQLLKHHERVIYIDCDVHHGDGVQQAFYMSSRVMTVSFHQHGQDFFPGTGGIQAVGQGIGKYYSINVPLKMGIDDDTYIDLFDTIMTQVMAKYDPAVIVLQLGADSLSHDVLGRLNLSIRGHGHCVQKMKTFGKPMIMLGGGGYTVKNVARLWSYQTGLALGENIQGEIPKQDRFYQAYGPQYKLHIPVKNTRNKNTPQYLNNIKMRVFEHLKNLQTRPGIPLHNIPTMLFKGYDDFQQQVRIQNRFIIKQQDQKNKKYEKSISSLKKRKQK